MSVWRIFVALNFPSNSREVIVSTKISPKRILFTIQKTLHFDEFSDEIHPIIVCCHFRNRFTLTNFWRVEFRGPEKSRQIPENSKPRKTCQSLLTIGRRFFWRIFWRKKPGESITKFVKVCLLSGTHFNLTIFSTKQIPDNPSEFMPKIPVKFRKKSIQKKSSPKFSYSLWMEEIASISRTLELIDLMGKKFTKEETAYHFIITRDFFGSPVNSTVLITLTILIVLNVLTILTFWLFYSSIYVLIQIRFVNQDRFWSSNNFIMSLCPFRLAISSAVRWSMFFFVTSIPFSLAFSRRNLTTSYCPEKLAQCKGVHPWSSTILKSILKFGFVRKYMLSFQSPNSQA